ncbi:thiamine phosphate synthase [Salininema proteolyticum]|uniref:Thiamine-phosphate synthase n=1 Tax=Salininema proteolyticum TaxID=1607685 RepID=A0ABV8TTJ2_9ACTN
MRSPVPLPRLHIITDTRPDADPVGVVEAALEAGARLVQVRGEDRYTDRLTFDLSRTIARLCREAGAVCLVNDAVHVAMAVGADGVHLGADDLPADAARAILPETAIVGATCRDPHEARAARRVGATYLGVGPVRASGTKTALKRIIGLDGMGAVAGAVDLPVIAIGGLDADLAAECVENGAHGVAVVSAVSRAADVKAAVGELLHAVGERAGTPAGAV